MIRIFVDSELLSSIFCR